MHEIAVFVGAQFVEHDFRGNGERAVGRGVVEGRGVSAVGDRKGATGRAARRKLGRAGDNGGVGAINGLAHKQIAWLKEKEVVIGIGDGASERRGGEQSNGKTCFERQTSAQGTRFLGDHFYIFPV